MLRCDALGLSFSTTEKKELFKMGYHLTQSDGCYLCRNLEVTVWYGKKLAQCWW